MALLDTITITGNTAHAVKLKNHNNSKQDKYTFLAYGGGGNNFGGGTVALNVSPDGTILVPVTNESGTAITFTENTGRSLIVNSDERNPVHAVFVMSGSTSPTVIIKIYDNQ